MKKFFTVFIFVLLSIAVNAQAWYVAGSHNGWCSTCDGMFDDGTHGDAVSADGIFTSDITVATPGRYEFKVTTADWSINFPGSNSWFITTVPNQVVKFTFNTNSYSDNWLPAMNIINVDDMPGPVTAVGAYQGWNNTGSEVMHDDGLDGDLVSGDGIYTWHAVIATPGSYDWKPAVSGSWDCWGLDNRGINSANAFFTTTETNQNVYLYLNKNTGRVATSAQLSLKLNLIVLMEGFFNESISKITPDTATVELHSADFPYNLVDSKQVLLDSSGHGTLYFDATSVVPYWIVVKHRNSIETWSYAAVTFVSSVLDYDFTWTQGAAYGNNLILKGTKWCIYSGDINLDGYVTADDYSGVDNDNTNFDYHAVNDVNGDGYVTADDYTCIDNNNTLFVQTLVP